jgi:hypothetical protein
MSRRSEKLCTSVGGLIRPIVLATVLLFSTGRSAAAGEVFTGVAAHDVNLGISVCCYEHGADVSLGWRSDPIVSLQHWGDLRLYAFGSANTEGGVAFAAAGAAWRLHLSDTLYLQPALGGAVQSGDADNFQRRPDHLDLGSRLLFEPELSLGYRIAPRWAVEATYVHLSHAQLPGPQNPGLDDLGVRLVYRLAP